MVNNLGYNKSLFILPFDHRSSFKKLGITKEQIILAKEIIYEAFKKAVSDGISKEEAAILVDEEYGDKIIRDAIKNNYNVILTTEKSGQEEFDFEYGNQFAQHIEKYKPGFVKALIRYGTNKDWTKLKLLSDYCHTQGYKFLLEVLTENKTASEALETIKEFQTKGIEPDVWKLEGMENQKDYNEIVRQATRENRSAVGVVVLGRGANKKTVEEWIATGAKVKGIIGFAVGRTVFWEPLVNFFNKHVSQEETVGIIAKNYLHFYNIFTL